jgi:hypothetical protein
MTLVKKAQDALAALRPCRQPDGEQKIRAERGRQKQKMGAVGLD